MKVVKHFNTLSQELIDSTKLKKDQIVKFRVHVVGVGKRKTTPLMPMMPAIPTTKNVPPSDQIWDDYKKTFVTIGAIRNVKSNGSPAFYDLTFRRATGGIITLRGGRAADQEIYSYMTLCDFNGSKPDRDPSKPILFHFVDEAKIADIRSEGRKNLRIALNTAADLSEADVKTYIVARGGDEKRPLKVLRDELEAFAEAQPDKFMEFIANAQTTVTAVVQRALNNGKIKFNGEQSRFEWTNGEPILTVARSGRDANEEFALWLRSDLKGEKVFQMLNTKPQPVKNNQQAKQADQEKQA